MLTRSLPVLCVLGCAAACGARPSLDDHARQYVRLAVALGERDPDSIDFYAGPAHAVADIRRDPPPLTAIGREAAALAGRVTGAGAPGSDAPRARELAANLAAIAARVALLTGTRTPYDEESRAFFGVAPAPADAHALEEIRSRIADIVGGKGRLVDRYAAFSALFTVPAERLPVVMRAAVDECRRATRAHLALPADEGVSLEFVRDKPWSAFSRYLGGARSVIQINTDFRFTVDQALQVACHEGYPGHHARNARLVPSRDEAGRPERAAQLMFAPGALESEAAAMLAADVAFPPDDRVRVERDRLFPLAGLNPALAGRHVAVERLAGDLQIAQAGIARRYLDGELEFARAVTALEEQALVPHAEALVKYINQYRSYITTYTEGRRLLAARLAACGGPDPAADVRWRCFDRETFPR